MAHLKRLKILSENEISLYFSKPQFIDADRHDFFTLSQDEHRLMQTLKTNRAKCYFIAQYGYFKAKKQFFQISFSEISSDLNFICKQYQLIKPVRNIKEDSQRKIRQMILKQENYHANVKAITEFLTTNAFELATQHTTPRALFDTLLIRLSNEKYVMPAYSLFQKIIGQAFKKENNRLELLLDKHLTQSAIKTLTKLLSTEKNYYEITRLRKDQKNFRYTENQKIIEYKLNYQSLYLTAKRIIPKLKIPHKMIDYYASLADHYPVAKIKKLKNHKSALYLLCYIFNRSRKFNDDLMSALAYYVDKYQKLAKEYGKQMVYEAKIELHKTTKKKLPKVLQLFIDKPRSDDTLREKAFKLIPKEKFPSIIEFLSGWTPDEILFRWEFFDKKQHEITKNLRPIFVVLDFECSSKLSALNDAILFMQEKFNKKIPLSSIQIKNIPLEFIPNSLKPYIISFDNSEKIANVNLARYEFCIYLMIRKEFKKNTIAIQDSIKNKRLEDDLIPKYKIKSIVKKINNPLLSLSLIHI